MVLHAALVQQDVAREQITLADCPVVARKGGAGDGEARFQRRHQRLGDGPDIAVIG